MDIEGKKMWFKAKSIGWGWTPVTWEGWAVTAIYAFLVASMVYSYLYFMEDVIALDEIIRNLIILSVFILIVTGCMIYICYKYGENPGRFKLWKK